MLTTVINNQILPLWQEVCYDDFFSFEDAVRFPLVFICNSDYILECRKGA